MFILYRNQCIKFLFDHYFINGTGFNKELKNNGYVYKNHTVVGLPRVSLIKKESGRPLKFYEASLFQFINPKAWSVAIAVASGFFPTEENIFIGVVFVTITAAIICFPSICCWALFGSGLRTFINNEKTKKITEYFLAFLLVLTGLFILIK